LKGFISPIASKPTAGGFVGGVLSTLAMGGNIGDALVNGLIGAAIGAYTAGFTFGIGTAVGTIGKEFLQGVTKIVAHGTFNGMRSMSQGGKFIHGFVAGAIGAASGMATMPLIEAGNGAWVGAVFISAALGGTASMLTGGNFANGAVTAAFVTLFNTVAHVKNNNQQKVETEEEGMKEQNDKRLLISNECVDKKIVYKPEEGDPTPKVLPVGTHKIGIDGINVEGKMYKFSDNIRSVEISPNGDVTVHQQPGFEGIVDLLKNLDPSIYWRDDWKPLRDYFKD
jgi:hypothetical protein